MSKFYVARKLLRWKDIREDKVLKKFKNHAMRSLTSDNSESCLNQDDSTSSVVEFLRYAVSRCNFPCTDVIYCVGACCNLYKLFMIGCVQFSQYKMVKIATQVRTLQYLDV